MSVSGSSSEDAQKALLPADAPDDTAVTQGKSAARRATSVETMAKPCFGRESIALGFDETTGRKSPGNEAESATPKGKDPTAYSPLGGVDPRVACRSNSYVASGDTTHEHNGAYSRADALTPFSTGAINPWIILQQQNPGTGAACFWSVILGKSTQDCQPSLEE